MEALNSSNLSGCDFDKETMTLTISFRSGATYSYAGVPEEVYESLRTAGSPGQYFNAAIKNAYGGVRVG
jgi:lysyl-tRNA synthetase class 2